MIGFEIQQLLSTQILSITDVRCDGNCRHKSAEECASSLHVVFPYRGIFMRHFGQREFVAEPNQLLYFNPDEPYRVSHPVSGGDACISISVADEIFAELTHGKEQPVQSKSKAPHRRIDTRAEVLLAILRHSFRNQIIEPVEAETLALTLIRRSLGESTSTRSASKQNLQKMVDRAKLALSADPARNWSLAEIGKEVGVSPVYLTQMFQKVEGIPLYRYLTRMRLIRALDLLGEERDLTELALELGFSSHSHFSSAFKKSFGTSPSDFRRATSGTKLSGKIAKEFDSGN
jgi:AraC-like DNA-binding protein